MANRQTRKPASKSKTAGRDPKPTKSRPGSGRSRTSPKPRNLLLRDIDPDVLEVLQARADRTGRSLQQELHIALGRDARRNFAEARALVDEWHSRLAGRAFPDTTGMIREDRAR